MLQKFWIAIVSLLVFLLLLDRVTPLRGAPKALREMKIGVVDFSRVAKKYSKYKRVKRRLDFEEKRIKSELEGIKQEMEVLEKEIKMYNPQSDLYKKKQREFVKKKAEFVYLVKKYQQELKEKAAKYTKEIVADLEQAIEAYGKANGFHIIFRRYLPIKGSVELNFNTVVYHSKAIDITEDVIKTVNEIFSHKSKKKSGKGNGSQNKEKKNP